MALILRRGRLALALVILIVVSLSFEAITVADARIPHKGARQLEDFDSPIQIGPPGNGGGSGGCGSRRKRIGPAPGSSRCKKGCCCKNKMGQCVCC